jgi:hypothetical protein
VAHGDDLAVVEEAGHPLGPLGVIGEVLERPSGTFQQRTRRSVVRKRPQGGGAHRVVGPSARTWFAQDLVPGPQGASERRACVARRGLHPDVIERTVAQQATVGDAVECDPAGEHGGGAAGQVPCVRSDPEHEVLDHDLCRAGQVAVASGDRLVATSGRSVEQVVQPPVGHA